MYARSDGNDSSALPLASVQHPQWSKSKRSHRIATTPSSLNISSNTKYSFVFSYKVLKCILHNLCEKKIIDEVVQIFWKLHDFKSL